MIKQVFFLFACLNAIWNVGKGQGLMLNESNIMKQYFGKFPHISILYYDAIFNLNCRQSDSSTTILVENESDKTVVCNTTTKLCPVPVQKLKVGGFYRCREENSPDYIPGSLNVTYRLCDDTSDACKLHSFKSANSREFCFETVGGLKYGAVDPKLCSIVHHEPAMDNVFRSTVCTDNDPTPKSMCQAFQLDVNDVFKKEESYHHLHIPCGTYFFQIRPLQSEAPGQTMGSYWHVKSFPYEFEFTCNHSSHVVQVWCNVDTHMITHKDQYICSKFLRDIIRITEKLPEMKGVTGVAAKLECDLTIGFDMIKSLSFAILVIFDTRVKLTVCHEHLRCEFLSSYSGDRRFRHFLKWEINGKNLSWIENRYIEFPVKNATTYSCYSKISFKSCTPNANFEEEAKYIPDYNYSSTDYDSSATTVEFTLKMLAFVLIICYII